MVSRLTINDPNEVEATILLVVIGAAVTELALWGRRQQDRASRRASYLSGVLGTAEIVALRKDQPGVLVDHIATQIQQCSAPPAASSPAWQRLDTLLRAKLQPTAGQGPLLGDTL